MLTFIFIKGIMRLKQNLIEKLFSTTANVELREKHILVTE